VVFWRIYYSFHYPTLICSNIAFIANPNADEIYEIQTFTPTSVEDYLKNYGSDITNAKATESKE
jgi:hypothetical protein